MPAQRNEMVSLSGWIICNCHANVRRIHSRQNTTVSKSTDARARRELRAGARRHIYDYIGHESPEGIAWWSLGKVKETLIVCSHCFVPVSSSIGV